MKRFLVFFVVIFMPSHNKSFECLYHDIMDEFDDFKINIAGKIKRMDE